MPDIFRVRFGDMLADGLPVTLDAANHRLSFLASPIPYNSLADLVTALITVLVADTVQIAVRWNSEPVEYEFQFSVENSAILFRIDQFPDSTRQHNTGQIVFTVHGSRAAIILPFWRALRSMESKVYETWQRHHPFPTSDMRKLDRHIQRLKHT
jgi:hypothetical protein